MKCTFIRKDHVEKEAGGLDYILNTFNGLTSEKQDYVLSIARSLLELQENTINSKTINNPSLKAKDSQLNGGGLSQ